MDTVTTNLFVSKYVFATQLCQRTFFVKQMHSEDLSVLCSFHKTRGCSKENCRFSHDEVGWEARGEYQGNYVYKALRAVCIHYYAVIGKDEPESVLYWMQAHNLVREIPKKAKNFYTTPAKELFSEAARRLMTPVQFELYIPEKLRSLAEQVRYDIRSAELLAVADKANMGLHSETEAFTMERSPSAI